MSCPPASSHSSANHDHSNIAGTTAEHAASDCEGTDNPHSLRQRKKQSMRDHILRIKHGMQDAEARQRRARTIATVGKAVLGVTVAALVVAAFYLRSLWS
ncbi:hypothetical protein BASA50_004588 [Batrachochytrium salamandrivorans]|uniref:Uncharacterized protein n=1 Tax=Batrachochytrium salamandrivorans TaxID=1357716 RepID=A0ABQ8FGD1_9FUNG|nr:hypothetical protein BASA62_008782 [Batrachochytrium salamandrivorans]KAH6574820.1 hypothetical protein BASA60_005291 [Batrachochytrium salamandrivorans]KAH6585419.1 hypothetical protein BASA61_006834 [Batrachochytrium salamandrivorans]KAH6597236.1 hypothetical protein BASA50_004588 [Batrachochytrium salamandrivorans]KAH9268150.1 hypothetical protein BASA84_000344 [Batrachochytrium salamandrivorans]